MKPIIKNVRKHCEACGRFVSGNVIVTHAHRENQYVCSVKCGLKVCDDKRSR